MTEEITVNLPKLGESIHSATIVQWFKQVGDVVALDEPLLEVSTDKVNSEIPSPAAGVVKEILAQVDQELQVGAPLLIIAPKEAVATLPTQEGGPAVISRVDTETSDAMKGFFSPSLLRLAQEKGVSMDELTTLKGTGGEGRVTKKDLEAHLAKKATLSGALGKTETIPMVGMRKAIADVLTRSYQEIPHAALVCQVDLTDVLAAISTHKARFYEKEGAKLTVTSCVIHALARALKAFPMLNAEVVGSQIVVKHFVNVGVAVSVNEGILVPVLKKCDEKDVTAIAKELADLSLRARAGALLPDEVKGGTVTLSNFGMSGMTMGLPIIRYPEVAIIGMAGIEKRLVVLEDETTAIRSLCNFSLSFDHRVVDGMYGCQFLAAFKENLERNLILF